MRDKSFHPGQMLFGVYVIKVQLGVGYLAEGGRLADIKVSNPKTLTTRLSFLHYHVEGVKETEEMRLWWRNVKVKRDGRAGMRWNAKSGEIE